jgi:hypothetical protein|eukprot:COSAG06_NODE_4782_length_3959_cov_5.747668_4_plen_239_part_00
MVARVAIVLGTLAAAAAAPAAAGTPTCDAALRSVQCPGSAASHPACWDGAYTFERCCANPPSGDPTCWDGVNTFASCCTPSEQGCAVCAGHNQQALRNAGCTHEDIVGFCAGGSAPTCAAHCKALGCTAGGGEACKTCVADHRHVLEGECWASPCPSHKCFSNFVRGYCEDGPTPSPPGPPPPPPPPTPTPPAGNGSSFFVAAKGGSDRNSGASFAEAFATLGHCLTSVASRSEIGLF